MLCIQVYQIVTDNQNLDLFTLYLQFDDTNNDQLNDTLSLTNTSSQRVMDFINQHATCTIPGIAYQRQVVMAQVLISDNRLAKLH